MYRKFKDGTVELIVGSMYAGKSSELIRRLDTLSYTKQEIVAFKPAIDDRYDASSIASHAGAKFNAYAVNSVEDIINKLKDHAGAGIIAFDEVQFFPLEIIALVSALADRGKRVICAGLNSDFRGVPFPITKEIMARAEFIDSLSAVCVVCGAPGTRTQRIVDGKPAHWDDPIILVGSEEAYESRCRHCHEVLGKPEFEL